MKRFAEGLGRGQSTLFPASLDDYVSEDNPVRAVDVFVDSLDLDKLGFVGVQPLDTGRPSYHPGVMLKLYIYGYLNRVPSSRRLERECQRNIEMIWLTGQLAPDFKTIADFRKDNGKAIREVCREFVALCRKLDVKRAGAPQVAGFSHGLGPKLRLMDACYSAAVGEEADMRLAGRDRRPRPGADLGCALANGSADGSCRPLNTHRPKKDKGQLAA
jgi:transposase